MGFLLDALDQALRELAPHEHYCRDCRRVWVCRYGGACPCEARHTAPIGQVTDYCCPPCFHAKQAPHAPEYLTGNGAYAALKRRAPRSHDEDPRARRAGEPASHHSAVPSSAASARRVEASGLH